MSDTFLTQIELAARWRISARSLERWRHEKVGPSFTRIGARVVYSIDDVLDYEKRRRAELRSATVLGSWR